jgi:hypothetical protein
VRVFVGGLAARLDLPDEQVDDLQLAVETVLARVAHAGELVTLDAAVADDALALRLGPLDAAALREDLASGEVGEGELGLERLLTALVERVDLIEDGTSTWLRIEKRIPPRPVG